LLPALLVERRDRQTDHLAVVDGREPEVGLLDRPLDLCQHALIPGLDRESPRVGHRDAGDLIERRRRGVVVAAHALPESGGCAAGAHAGELAAKRLEGSLHPGLGILLDRLRRVHSLTSVTGAPSLTKDPTVGSPQTTRSRFPGVFRLKTPIGSLFSMHREMA